MSESDKELRTLYERAEKLRGRLLRFQRELEIEDKKRFLALSDLGEACDEITWQAARLLVKETEQKKDGPG